ncbi:serine/threonine-protein kinase [Nocardia sp. NPDC087230]|uniref:serine/threonine-protein kinase n=1 Tax=Nocardia sp. NPDC087230 TaxID=3364331 RepID=UPI0038249258
MLLVFALGDVFAGYAIEKVLGRGGIGTVYLARHPRLPRWTAIKVLNPEQFSDPEIRARFEREADLVAGLEHPNIVTVYDRGVDAGQLWISMRYIQGGDAASLPQPLDPIRAVHIISETAKALDFAHSRGVFHRDVKPANILIEPLDQGQERIHLTDFGIARLVDGDATGLTRPGTFMATLAFASPEQLTGITVDGRSDQYSLACTLFRLLTGTAPFEAMNPAVVIQGHLQQPPPRVSSVRADLPLALDDVLATAMAKRPQDRYPNCAAFAAAAAAAVSAPAVTTSAQDADLAARSATTRLYQVPEPRWAEHGQPPLLTPVLAPPPPPAHQPRPPARSARSGKLPVLVGLAITVALVISISIGITLTSRGDSPSADASTTTTAAKPIVPDAAAIHTAFPAMVPADTDTSTGYGGTKCYSFAAGTKDMWWDPDFGDWKWKITCQAPAQASSQIFFRIYAYSSALAVESVARGLPAPTKSVDTNTAAGKPYTNYSFIDTGNQEDQGHRLDAHRIVTVFTGDPARSQFLMYTEWLSKSPTLAGSAAELKQWWKSAPLN